MKTKIHAAAGTLALLTIVAFWTATLTSELLLPPDAIATVKAAILIGMAWLVPALVLTGATGLWLAHRRPGPYVRAKRRRMPFIAANGLLVLLPSAIFLESKAALGDLDATFYAVQIIELVAGALNIALLGLSMRDGLRLTGRFTSRRPSRAHQLQPLGRNREKFYEYDDVDPLDRGGAPRVRRRRRLLLEPWTRIRVGLERRS